MLHPFPVKWYALVHQQLIHLSLCDHANIVLAQQHEVSIHQLIARLHSLVRISFGAILEILRYLYFIPKFEIMVLL